MRARARPQHSTKHTRASSINSVCVHVRVAWQKARTCFAFLRTMHSETCTQKGFSYNFSFFFVFRKVLMFTASLDGSYTIPTNVL